MSYRLKHDVGLGRMPLSSSTGRWAGSRIPRSIGTRRSTRRASAASGCAPCCASPAPASATTSIGGRTPRFATPRAGFRPARRQALLETYERLQARFADEADWRRLVGVRRALVARRKRLADDGALPERIAAFGEALQAVRERLPSWPLDSAGLRRPGARLSSAATGAAARPMHAVAGARATAAFTSGASARKITATIWSCCAISGRPRSRRAAPRPGRWASCSATTRSGACCARPSLPRPSASATAPGCCSSCRRRQAELRAQMWPPGARLLAERPRRWCGATRAIGRPGGARPIEPRWTRPPDLVLQLRA